MSKYFRRYYPVQLALLFVAVTAVAVAGQRDGDKPDAKQQRSDSKATKSAKAEKPEKVIRSDAQWREILTREEFRVLRRKGTERPFRNKYDKHFEPGTYACAACGQKLFSSKTKFNSGCGWPAFYAAKAGDKVILKPDYSNRMIRTEVLCARCNSHLGHVFRDAPQTPTGNRYCINSVALDFIPAKAAKQKSQKGSASRLRPATKTKQKDKDSGSDSSKPNS